MFIQDARDAARSGSLPRTVTISDLAQAYLDSLEALKRASAAGSAEAADYLAFLDGARPFLAER